IAKKSIPANLSIRDDGYWLDITYSPTSLGMHETKLQLIADDLDSAPPVVYLRGECLEKPVLTACTALEPSDITESDYSANWSTPDGEVVDYWIITRTKYVNGAQESEEILAEGSPWTISGFDSSDFESYSVQSVRLGERSPMSNVVFVRHAGITGVEIDEPLTVTAFPGIIRFDCANPQTGCRIHDITGRLVQTIDRIERDMDITIPLGVYFITTDQHHTPIKIAVR
ncbi:MAG: hypothetical protein K2J10_02550, partial [Muribaculaceae bacterium]|nr:hypothetical protein [Muribaculaceae bacterium]